MINLGIAEAGGNESIGQLPFSSSRGKASVQAQQAPPRILTSSNYPRWMELVKGMIDVSPKAFMDNQTSWIMGVLNLIYEESPYPWTLTVLDGDAALSSLNCYETRHHLLNDDDRWDWVVKGRRRDSSQPTETEKLLFPASVATHAKLMKNSVGVHAYTWGAAGYFAVICFGNIRVGIREIPGIPESNEVIFFRNTFENGLLKSLNSELIYQVFGRLENSHDAPIEHHCLIDDEASGLTAIPSAFLSVSSQQQNGIIGMISKSLKMAGPGNEAHAWNQVRASDQYRFNVERLRQHVIPYLLNTSDNTTEGAAESDVISVVGIAKRMEKNSKEIMTPGYSGLAQTAIKIAIAYLIDCTRSDKNSKEAALRRIYLFSNLYQDLTGKEIRI